MNLFKKKKYVSVSSLLPLPKSKKEIQKEIENQPIIPDGLWIKCPKCGETIYKNEMSCLKVCPKCYACFRLTAEERINSLVDKNSFEETNKTLTSKNPLNYPNYEKKIQKLKEELNLSDAVVTGIATIGGEKTVLCVMDSRFIMGSMGSVVGEKITRAFEQATKEKLPIIIFTASGGARMQEGIISLMQMAKVSAAAKRHSSQGLLYVTVLTDPTTGGVTASFAMLGDIILSEPKALIGFAGRRVIEQTIKQSLPEEFQTAEFLLEHGFIDQIVPRGIMSKTLATILKIHSNKSEKGGF